jgi:hypothetical protein
MRESAASIPTFHASHALEYSILRVARLAAECVDRDLVLARRPHRHHLRPAGRTRRDRGGPMAQSATWTTFPGCGHLGGAHNNNIISSGWPDRSYLLIMVSASIVSSPLPLQAG